MATVPTPIPAKKMKKPTPVKHTITLTFEDKYASLYEELDAAADADDRSLSQYVLLFLRDNHQAEKKEE